MEHLLLQSGFFYPYVWSWISFFVACIGGLIVYILLCIGHRPHPRPQRQGHMSYVPIDPQDIDYINKTIYEIKRYLAEWEHESRISSYTAHEIEQHIQIKKNLGGMLIELEAKSYNGEKVTLTEKESYNTKILQSL